MKFAKVCLILVVITAAAAAAAVAALAVGSLRMTCSFMRWS